jgi:hypothetical protein
VVLELKYGCWLRPTEEFKLAAVFAALVWTRRKTQYGMQRFAVIPPVDVSGSWDFVEEPIGPFEAFGLLSAGTYVDKRKSVEVVARAVVQDILKLPPKSGIYTVAHVPPPQEMIPGVVTRSVKIGWRTWKIGKGLGRVGIMTIPGSWTNITEHH